MITLSPTSYEYNNRCDESNLKSELIYNKEQDINELIISSLTGKVHRFDETMSKELINKKMDDLFGW